MKRTVTFLSDPGHGWLSVAIRDLALLGIAGKISSYSYMKGNRAYLEEDCDASVFINAAKAAGWDITVKHRSTNNRSPIRSYHPFCK